MDYDTSYKAALKLNRFFMVLICFDQVYHITHPYRKPLLVQGGKLKLYPEED